MTYLFQIAINDTLPIEIRYDAARMMQDTKRRKLPKWKVRVLKHFAKEESL